MSSSQIENEKEELSSKLSKLNISYHELWGSYSFETPISQKISTDGHTHGVILTFNQERTKVMRIIISDRIQYKITNLIFTDDEHFYRVYFPNTCYKTNYMPYMRKFKQNLKRILQNKPYYEF